MTSLLYVRTAKTASTTIDAWRGGQSASTFNQKFLTEPPNDLTMSKALEHNQYLFTSVRNPFTRAISCWQQAMRIDWIPKNSTFEDFLDVDFNAITNTHFKTHVIPIAHYLEPYLCDINKVVKVEQLEKGLREIEDKFGREHRPIKAFNRGTYRTPRDGFDYKSFYTEERIERVLDKYADDFIAFDYSKSIDF